MSVFPLTQTPRIIPSLFAWYDGSDPLGTGVPPANNTQISPWYDKSGNGYNATNGTGSAQPTYKSNILGGNGVINFDGSDDTLTMPSGVYSLANGNNTAFVVSNTTSDSTTQRVVYMTEGGAANSRWFVAYSTTSGNVNFNSSTSNASVSATGVTKANYNIFSCYRSGTTQSISVNNAAETTNASGASESGVDAASIGSNGGGAGFVIGNIAEIIIYNRALSAADIIQINRYLSNKWGIAIT